MRIGVVVPTYNQAAWLPGALCSILNHGEDLVRVVVVNDGSTDTTRKILREFDGVEIVDQDNAGTAAAINAGVELLGESVDALTWCSSDNFMTPGWLAVLAEGIRSGAGAVYAGFQYCAPKRCAYHFTDYDPDRLLRDLNCYIGPAFLVDRDVWDRAGPQRGRISHDYDHWLRIEEVCSTVGKPIVGIDRMLCWYMAHDQRVTVTRSHEFDAPQWQAEARWRRL